MVQHLVERCNNENFNPIAKNICSPKKKFTCEKCGTVTEYDDTIASVGDFGCAIAYCPHCGTKNFLDDEELELNLTTRNVLFPQHFSHTAGECCKHIEDDELTRESRKCAERAKGDGFAYWASGDSAVIALDFDEETVVFVSKDYYETSIPKYLA